MRIKCAAIQMSTLKNFSGHTSALEHWIFKILQQSRPNYEGEDTKIFRTWHSETKMWLHQICKVDILLLHALLWNTLTSNRMFSKTGNRKKSELRIGNWKIKVTLIMVSKKEKGISDFLKILKGKGNIFVLQKWISVLFRKPPNCYFLL